MRFSATCCLTLCLASSASAGLYYSGETYAELPSQWRGFLLDHRALRNIAAAPTKGNPASPDRQRYLDAAAKLAKKGPLSADEAADLGALYVRLGQADRAIEVLRPAQQRHADHFHINANLGTAWQLRGDLAQAALCLDAAVRLAPEKYRQAESLHLKLVRQRQRQAKGTIALDDLFGIRYVGDKGEFEPGKLTAAQKKKLPSGAVAQAQQLALWLPADGPLLWQLAELANAHGDVKNAAAMMDGCVTTFAMSTNAELRRHRARVRAVADEEPKTVVKQQHQETHGLTFRSKKPLLSRIDPKSLPAISNKTANALPWDLLGETVLDNKARPTFHRYLQDLAGKEVTLTGFMQPMGDGPEYAAFLLVEYPIGCWFCEMPDMANMIYVELPAGTTMTHDRQLLRVTGRFTLNANDPEDFLYAIRGARVGGID